MTTSNAPAGAELPQFMTVEEIATLLRVSRATAYRLIRSGALTATDVGRSVRVPRRAVDDFLHRNVRPATDPRADRP